MAVRLLGGHTADRGHGQEGGTVGQGVQPHRGHADNTVEGRGVDAIAQISVRHQVGKNGGAAQRGAGDAGEDAHRDDAGDIGIQVFAHPHGEVGEQAESRAGVDYGGEAHCTGVQQQNVNGGEETLGEGLCRNPGQEAPLQNENEDDGDEQRGIRRGESGPPDLHQHHTGQGHEHNRN